MSGGERVFPLTAGGTSTKCLEQLVSASRSRRVIAARRRLA